MYWLRQIENASSAGEIIAVTRDYLATWTPHDLAKLPRECRPGRVKSPGDLEQLHASLVEEYRQNRLTGEALSALQRLTSFVVRASLRLAQFGESPGQDGESPPQASAAGHDPSDDRPEAGPER